MKLNLYAANAGRQSSRGSFRPAFDVLEERSLLNSGWGWESNLWGGSGWDWGGISDFASNAWDVAGSVWNNTANHWSQVWQTAQNTYQTDGLWSSAGYLGAEATLFAMGVDPNDPTGYGDYGQGFADLLSGGLPGIFDLASFGQSAFENQLNNGYISDYDQITNSLNSAAFDGLEGMFEGYSVGGPYGAVVGGLGKFGASLIGNVFEAGHLLYQAADNYFFPNEPTLHFATPTENPDGSPRNWGWGDFSTDGFGYDFGFNDYGGDAFSPRITFDDYASDYGSFDYNLTRFGYDESGYGDAYLTFNEYATDTGWGSWDSGGYGGWDSYGYDDYATDTGWGSWDTGYGGWDSYGYDDYANSGWGSWDTGGYGGWDSYGYDDYANDSGWGSWDTGGYGGWDSYGYDDYASDSGWGSGYGDYSSSWDWGSGYGDYSSGWGGYDDYGSGWGSSGYDDYSSSWNSWDSYGDSYGSDGWTSAIDPYYGGYGSSSFDPYFFDNLGFEQYDYSNELIPHYEYHGYGTPSDWYNSWDPIYQDSWGGYDSGYDNGYSDPYSGYGTDYSSLWGAYQDAVDAYNQRYESDY